MTRRCDICGRPSRLIRAHMWHAHRTATPAEVRGLGSTTPRGLPPTRLAEAREPRPGPPALPSADLAPRGLRT